MPPPIVVEDDGTAEATLNLSSQIGTLESLDWELPDLSDLQLPPDGNNDETLAMIHEVYSASLGWAANLVSLTKHFTPSQLSDFWPSCMFALLSSIHKHRITDCLEGSTALFSFTSNFLLVTLVQSPTPEMAVRAKEMLNSWQQVVLGQSKVSPLFLPTLARLNCYLVAGLSEVFSPTAISALC
jgi:hypothetical protein